MNIVAASQGYFIIRTKVGNIHIYEENEKLKINYYDHLNIEIVGDHKKNPLVVIDSDEYPTKLLIKQTEGKFNEATDLEQYEYLEGL